MSMTRDDYVNALKAGFVSTATRLVKAELVIVAPWTANPIAALIIDHFLNDIFSKLATQAEMAVFFAYIDARGVAQGRDFTAAANELRLAVDSGDVARIKNAETKVKETLRALVVVTN